MRLKLRRLLGPLWEDPLDVKQQLAMPTLRYSLGTAMRAMYRPKVEGREHVPLSGAAIIASNHLAFSDSLFLQLLSPRPMSFLAKMEYFDTPGIKGRAMATFFTVTGSIPVDRAGGRGAVAALQAGLDVLERGDLFGIYPEGTRSPDGRLYKGRTGAAHLALQAGVPVIPAAVAGTENVQPNGRRWPGLARVRVKFGEPLDFSRHEGLAGNKHVVRAVTDEIIDAIRALSGQEYVDRYATQHAPRESTKKSKRRKKD